MKIEVLVRFMDQPEIEHRREFRVPPWGRWVMNLDDLRPGFVGMTDAVTRIVCAGPCWASSAIYFAPIGRGAVAAITPVQFGCS